MKNMFSAGELAKYQKISKQTLLFYDKINLFKPAYTDPSNGYRYYSAEQLDYLDTILIMKKTGFSLEEIRQHMKAYTTESSIDSFRQQLKVIDERIKELTLIKSRLEHRCNQVERAFEMKYKEPVLEICKKSFILFHEVIAPFDSKEISLATKKCYAQAFNENLPVYFQCGVSVPIEKIKEEKYTEASIAFLSTEQISCVSNIKELPSGLAVSLYHFGNYYDMSDSYKKLLDFCNTNKLRIISDSYEFCINDYITSRYEDEFITKIMFYVEEE